MITNDLLLIIGAVTIGIRDILKYYGKYLADNTCSSKKCVNYLPPEAKS
jgi:hypothetical protein